MHQSAINKKNHTRPFIGRIDALGSARARSTYAKRASCAGVKRLAVITKTSKTCNADSASDCCSRRALLAAATLALPASGLYVGLYGGLPAGASEGVIAKYEPMDALKGKDYGKPRMTYKDYTMTPSGLQYQDLKRGDGEEPRPGDTVVIDWDGYTIGYYGRPFEARNKPKGSSFSGENKDFYRFVLGDGKVIPAFEEAVASMKPGGIRRIIVPVELGYPENDWRRLGPKPSTFAGDRALDFVLANKGMIDKTLLFDVELVRVQRK